MQKILYLHAGAEMYGADKVLLELIKGLDKDAFEAHVILPNDGVLVSALEKVGAKVKVIDYPILRRKYLILREFLSILVLIIVIQSKLLNMLRIMALLSFTTIRLQYLRGFISNVS